MGAVAAAVCATAGALWVNNQQLAAQVRSRDKVSWMGISRVRPITNLGLSSTPLPDWTISFVFA